MSDNRKENLEIATKKQKIPDANNPKTWKDQPAWGWRYYVDKGNRLILRGPPVFLKNLVNFFTPLFFELKIQTRRIEEIEVDEETKRAKHCQLWKVPLPEIKYGEIQANYCFHHSKLL